MTPDMRLDVLTIFPEYLAPLDLSLVGKARRDGMIDLRVHDLRDAATDRHRTVDDAPFGGGAGMVMRPDVWGEAIDRVLPEEPGRAILLVPTPAGEPFSQTGALELAREVSCGTRLVFACGRYEGIDARVAEHYGSRARVQVVEVSIGDYVLGGGEVAVLAIVEAVARLLPGVVGNPESLVEESHGADGLLEYPVYTRPSAWRGLDVPAVLTSGHHGAVARWRRDQALVRTATRRPDLLRALPAAALDRADWEVLTGLGWRPGLGGSPSAPVTVRLAEAGDAVVLADVAAATFPHACPPETTLGATRAFIAEHLSAEAFADYLADPVRTLVLAEDAQGALGYAMLVAAPPADPDVLAVVPERPAVELSKFYLLPRAHRSGAAAVMMAECAARAGATGAGVLWLGVNQRNERAQSFYRRCGFTRRGVKRFRVGERWEDDYVLARSVDVAE